MAIKIKSLHIYPLKSASGITLNKLKFESLGPLFDRRWMVINEFGQFISQRTHPKMATLNTELNVNDLILTHSEVGKLILPLNKSFLPSDTGCEAKLFSKIIKGYDCGKLASDWISDFLHSKAKIIFYHPQAYRRTVDPQYTDDESKEVAFADGFPWLLTSQETLDNLNQKLSKPIGMDRFRPNIVVEGTTSDEEDNWINFKIGDYHFKNAKPCSRCKVTTINQAQGISQSHEPLDTLKTYRFKDGKIYFGINLIHEGSGELKIGDVVTLN